MALDRDDKEEEKKYLEAIATQFVMTHLLKSQYENQQEEPNSDEIKAAYLGYLKEADITLEGVNNYIEKRVLDNNDPDNAQFIHDIKTCLGNDKFIHEVHEYINLEELKNIADSEITDFITTWEEENAKDERNLTDDDALDNEFEPPFPGEDDEVDQKIMPEQDKDEQLERAVARAAEENKEMAAFLTGLSSFVDEKISALEDREKAIPRILEQNFKEYCKQNNKNPKDILRYMTFASNINALARNIATGMSNEEEENDIQSFLSLLQKFSTDNLENDKILDKNDEEKSSESVITLPHATRDKTNQDLKEKRIRELDTENTQLRLRIASLEKAQIKPKIGTADTANNYLEFHEQKSEIIRLKFEIERLREQFDALNKENKESSLEKTSLQKRLKELEIKYDKLSRSNELMEESVKTAKKKTHAADIKISALERNQQKEKERWEQDIAKLSINLKQAREDQEAEKRAKESLEQQLLEEENLRVTAANNETLNREQPLFPSLNSQLLAEEIERLKKEAADAKTSKDVAEQKLKENEEIINSYPDALIKIGQEAEKEITQANEKAEQAEKTAAAATRAKEEAEEAAKAQKARNDQLSATLKNNEEKLNEIRPAAAQDQAQDSAQQQATALAQKEAEAAKQKAAEAEQRASASDAEAAQTKAQLAQSESELTQLRANQKGLEDLARQLNLSLSNATVADLSREIAKLSQQASQNEVHLAESERLKRELELQVTALSAQNGEISRKQEEMVTANRSLSEERDRIQQELAASRNRMEAAEQSARQVREENSRIVGKNTEAQAQLQANATDRETSQRKIRELTQQNSEAQSQIATQEQQLLSIQEQLEQTKKANGVLVKRVQTAEAQAEKETARAEKAIKAAEEAARAATEARKLIEGSSELAEEAAEIARKAEQRAGTAEVREKDLQKELTSAREDNKKLQEANQEISKARQAALEAGEGKKEETKKRRAAEKETADIRAKAEQTRIEFEEKETALQQQYQTQLTEQIKLLQQQHDQKMAKENPSNSSQYLIQIQQLETQNHQLTIQLQKASTQIDQLKENLEQSGRGLVRKVAELDEAKKEIQDLRRMISRSFNVRSKPSNPYLTDQDINIILAAVVKQNVEKTDGWKSKGSQESQNLREQSRLSIDFQNGLLSKSVKLVFEKTPTGIVISAHPAAIGAKLAHKIQQDVQSGSTKALRNAAGNELYQKLINTPTPKKQDSAFLHEHNPNESHSLLSRWRRRSR